MKDGPALHRSLDSRLELVDPLCAEMLAFLSDRGVENMDFTVDLLLREFINNAIIHGNGLDPRKKVQVLLCLETDGLRLEVQDKGPGFDWASREKDVPPEEAVSGRGLAIGTLYAGRMEFNDSGNKVVLHIPFSKDKEAVVEDDLRIVENEDRYTIMTGDRLTAELVPRLQEVIKGLVEKGARTILLDLSATKILDSSGIGLMIAASNTLVPLGGTLGISNVSVDIYNLLASMRLAGRLNVTVKPPEAPNV